MIVTVGVSIFYMLFLLYPLISMLSKSVIGEDGGFTWQYFAKVFHKKYYQRAVWGSLKISATVTLITVLLATPLAYIMSTVKIRFAGALQILILVSSMSAPFIGAYAWIMLCGRNGTITNFLLNTFGFKLGDIYGFKGCVIVMSLQLYSLVFMFVSGAFKNLDNSLIEASARSPITAPRCSSAKTTTPCRSSSTRSSSPKSVRATAWPRQFPSSRL